MRVGGVAHAHVIGSTCESPSPPPCHRVNAQGVRPTCESAGPRARRGTQAASTPRQTAPPQPEYPYQATRSITHQAHGGMHAPTMKQSPSTPTFPASKKNPLQNQHVIPLNLDNTPTLLHHTPTPTEHKQKSSRRQSARATLTKSRIIRSDLLVGDTGIEPVTSSV